MITFKFATLTALAVTTLVGATLTPTFAQRPYNGDRGYDQGGYGRDSNRDYDQNNGYGRDSDRGYGRDNGNGYGRNHGYGYGRDNGRYNDRDNSRDNDQSQLRWSGNVDDTAIITLRGRDVRTRAEQGRGITNVSEQVSGQLPNRRVNVALRQVRGRGQVDVIEQPSPRNNYTARVRVRDSQGGSARYSFVLDWGR